MLGQGSVGLLYLIRFSLPGPHPRVRWCHSTAGGTVRAPRHSGTSARGLFQRVDDQNAAGTRMFVRAGQSVMAPYPTISSGRDACCMMPCVVIESRISNFLLMSLFDSSASGYALLGPGASD